MLRRSIALLALFTVACTDNPILPDGIPAGTNFRVNHFQQTCVGIAPWLCMGIQQQDKVGSEEWDRIYQGIKDFDYELGFIYNLKVKTKQIKNPPADGSSIEYHLEKVISKDKVSMATRFSLGLTLSYSGGLVEYFIQGDVENGFTILSQINVDCGDLCDELTQKITDQEEMVGVFVHQDENTIKLIGFE